MKTRPRRLAIALAGLGMLTAAPAGADIYMTRGRDGSLRFTNVAGHRGRGSVVVLRSREAAASANTPTQVITATGDAVSADASAAAPAQSAQIRSMYLATARDPSRYTRFDEYIREASALYQIPEALVRAMIREESDFNPYSVSPVGAAGLMQLMPSTAQSMSVSDVFDPRQSILGGTRFLRVLANMFNGDLVLTIAAYNAGPNAVIRHSGMPPYESVHNYVRMVLRYYYLYRAGQMPEQLAAARDAQPATEPVAP